MLSEYEPFVQKLMMGDLAIKFALKGFIVRKTETNTHALVEYQTSIERIQLIRS